MVLSDEQIEALRTEPLTGRNKVETARKLAHLTQVVLAREVGLTQARISSIENGLYGDMPLETSRRLAGFFGCAIEDLFPATVLECERESA